MDYNMQIMNTLHILIYFHRGLKLYEKKKAVYENVQLFTGNACWLLGTGRTLFYFRTRLRDNSVDYKNSNP
jgi:hypothetical protein